ncbi:MAG: hypothetical protein ACE5HE_07400, partial [Phycisphaerae bacterium]
GAISSLTLGGTSDFLRGTAVFEIECATFDPECDIDVDLFDYRLLRPCIAGPGRAPAVGCRRYDADGDSDVDLKDVAAFLVQFTGQQ